MDNTANLQKAIELIKNAEELLDNCFKAHCETVGITPDQAEKFYPHEIRVFVERNELSEKIEKLSIFLASATASELSVSEVLLFDRQLKAMTQYRYILNLRINTFYGRIGSSIRTKL